MRTRAAAEVVGAVVGAAVDASRAMWGGLCDQC
jgi:hypothetical protein